MALWRSRLSSVSSGSKRLRTTNVDPSPIPTIDCMKPSAWNAGTHISVTSPARNGTLLSRPPSRPSDRGSERGAPFGLPVVPLVRIVIFGVAPAFGGLLGSPRLTSASSVSSPSSSVHAR